jgi:excisionase family DNA binding protein
MGRTSKAPRHTADVPKQPPPDRLALSPAEAAWLLGVTPWTVRAWIRDGQLKGVRLAPKMIRIARADVERFLADRAEAEAAGA